MSDDGSVQQLWMSKGIGASLTHYPANGSHRLHAHDHTQISFVLSGELREELEGREHVARCGMRGHKPAGARHADFWGSQGVLIFTLTFFSASADELQPGWTTLEDSQTTAALVRIVAESDDPEVQDEAIQDLAAAGPCIVEPPGEPPPWLEQARAAIDEMPRQLAIEALASETGVHRGYLSRQFRRYYGVPPSIYRRRAMVTRAVQALVRSNLPLAQVAAESGFFDQAHLSRTIRSHLGLAPAKLRTLLER